VLVVGPVVPNVVMSSCSRAAWYKSAGEPISSFDFNAGGQIEQFHGDSHFEKSMSVRT